jgi:ATP-dependent DNA helicase RecG
LGISNVGQLLLHRPRRYEDRRHFISIRELPEREPRTVRGRVTALGTTWFRRRSKSVFELIVDDGTARLHCRWWNLPFMENYFKQGDEVFVFGKMSSIKPRTMDHPETEVIPQARDEDGSIHMNRVVPIYPLTEGLPQRWLRGLIWRALDLIEPQLAEPWGDVRLEGFLPFRAAMRNLHFPAELDDAEEARRRLALDELIELQRAIQQRRRNLEAQTRALPCGGDNRLMKPFLRQLGFNPTTAQTKVLREIRADLSGAVPMRRLLQGDVGSGKTLVAACAALMALESGFNVVLMAPTEILAEQHFQTFCRWFMKLDIPVLLRTGTHKVLVGDRRPSLMVGTHALIEATLPNLGLVIIDEQHKFGVAQREKLVRKGNYPHLLVMTATPIPRTLGLTIYGDLDVSVIDELPGGRGKVETFVRSADKLPKVWEFVKAKLGTGRQAFVVYPRVEESDGTIKAVLDEAERIQEILAPFRVEVLHGRLKPVEKERVMGSFRTGKTAVLVATSIIEVGVNVPNASVMVIENAEQFGLAQLHQLRGRIGRGAHESYCVLIAAKKTPEVRQRLGVLEETTDGFRVAEEDLKLRGPGELLGREQSGLPSFRFADLTTDWELLQKAREAASAILGAKAHS